MSGRTDWEAIALLYEGLRRGQATEARHAYVRAVGLSEDAAVREFLVARSGDLE